MFVKAALERGWIVTHKWALAHGNSATLSAINALPFDFQGAVDMGVLLHAHFYIGLQGSAFSHTIGNARDKLQRYRGSSFEFDDDDARTHLYNNMDSPYYACCL